MGQSEALATWDSLVNDIRSFFGIICAAGRTVQFIWDTEDVVTIDVPLPERSGSLAKQSDFDECRSIIKMVFDGGDPTNIPNLYFLPW